jgi:hypothetical protein
MKSCEFMMWWISQVKDALVGDDRVAVVEWDYDNRFDAFMKDKVVVVLAAVCRWW